MLSSCDRHQRALGVHAVGHVVASGGSDRAARGLHAERDGLLQPEAQVLHAHRRRPPHARR